MLKIAPRFGTHAQHSLTQSGWLGTMFEFESARMARFAIKIAVAMLAVFAAVLTGRKGAALSTTPPLPAPGEAHPPGAGRAPPGVPVVPNETYTLDSGVQIRIVVLGQQSLSNVYTVDGSGAPRSWRLIPSGKKLSPPHRALRRHHVHYPVPR